MTDIVTGGLGFIGSHLADKLRKDHDVLIFDIKSGMDIRQPVNFPKSDRIFHLAALADIVPSIDNPVGYFHTNVTGTLNVLEAARKSGCKKFIYAASASCYGYGEKNDPADQGEPYDTLPMREEDQRYPQYPYALTKYLGEQLVMHWSKVYGIPAVSLRLFNVYGPRSRTNGTYGAMFGTFLAQLANNKPLTIVGDGTQSRDFIYVSDVVEAMLMAADSNCMGIYNVGTGRPVSVNRIVELLASKETVHIPKRPGEPDVACADISKIERDLGWEPKVSIEEGVAKLLKHLPEYRDAPVWVPETIEMATAEWFRRLA